METSSILIGILLFVAAIAFVIRPFRQKQRAYLNGHKTVVSPEDRRKAVLSALRDLDFDFKIGKVSEEDYTPLRAQLVVEASQYIEQDTEEEKKLEALIQTRRATQQQTMNCEHCGAEVEAGQRFCAKCGSAVHREACPSCGRKIRAGDQFCSSCGTRIGIAMETVAQP